MWLMLVWVKIDQITSSWAGSSRLKWPQTWNVSSHHHQKLKREHLQNETTCGTGFPHVVFTSVSFLTQSDKPHSPADTSWMLSCSCFHQQYHYLQCMMPHTNPVELGTSHTLEHAHTCQPPGWGSCLLAFDNSPSPSVPLTFPGKIQLDTQTPPNEILSF